MNKSYAEEFEILNKATDNVPVDVDLLAKALDLELKYTSLDDEISGMIERLSDDRFRIVVNSNHAKTRQRFTIAHEIAHYMLHRNLIGDGITDNKAYRSADKGQYSNSRVGSRQEAEANKLAATILMPLEPVKKLRQILSGINDPSVIAEVLGVSTQAYKIRMGIAD